MKVAMKKVFALFLSLALMLTGITLVGGGTVSAAEEHGTISIQILDENNDPMEGVVPTLQAYQSADDTRLEDDDFYDDYYESDEQGKVEIDLGDESDNLWPDQEIPSYPSYEPIYYKITADVEGYEATPVKLSLGLTAAGALYVKEVNDVAYTGGDIILRLAPPSSAWPEDCFTYSADKATITGLSDAGKAKLKTDSELILPDTHDGVAITEIAAGQTGMGKLDGADGQIGTFGFNENGVSHVPTKVTFPSGLKKIGNYAFMAAYNTTGSDQKGLSELALPETLEEIGLQAFAAIPTTSVTIPASVKTMGQAAFQSSIGLGVKLATLTFETGSQLKTIPQSAFAQQEILTVEIPSGVTKVDRMAFTGNFSTSITIPDTVTEIGDQAFQNLQCESLVIPASVTKIGKSAFRFYSTGYDGEGQPVRSSKLATLTLNEGLVTIDKQAFDGNKLTSVSIPSTVTTLDNMAFDANTGQGEDHRVNVTVSEAQFNGAGRTGTYSKFIAFGSGHRAVYNNQACFGVSFDTAGRTAVGAVSTDTSGKVVLPEGKTADKYDTFDGWYTAAEGGDKVDNNRVYTEDTTLYAHWINPLEDAKTALATAEEAAVAAQTAADTAEASKEAADKAAATPGQAAVDAAKKAEADAKAAADAATAAKAAADLAKEKADAAVAYADEQSMSATNKKKATDVQANAADAVTAAQTAKETADQKYSDAQKATKKAEADKKAADDKAAEEKAKTVKTVTVNAKTVSAKAVDAAVKKAGGSDKYVTKIVLSKKTKKISKNAFKQYKKVTVLEIKTKKLKKKAVKGALKGSAVKKVKVKVGNKKANKKFVKKYKRFFTKKNAGKKVKVTR